MIDIGSLIDNYTEEELRKIVKESFSMKEVLSKLGYKTLNGRNSNTIKKRIERYQIDYSHFTVPKKVERNMENIFCINSTTPQNTLRRWYKKISDDSKCQICNQDKIWNGKELTMTLDHINGDNHDNRLENLRWICPNCGSQLPTFAGRNNKNHNGYISVVTKKVSKKICPICNLNEIYKQSKMCSDCRSKENEKKSKKPSKEILEELIYEKTFVQIGRDYGVSDNAVRKWCKSYDLPYRYGELHKNAS